MITAKAFTDLLRGYLHAAIGDAEYNIPDINSRFFSARALEEATKDCIEASLLLRERGLHVKDWQVFGSNFLRARNGREYPVRVTDDMRDFLDNSLGGAFGPITLVQRADMLFWARRL